MWREQVSASSFKSSVFFSLSCHQFDWETVQQKAVEYPREVTSYLSIYSLFARAILICATCGSRCLRIKNTGVKSASGSLGLIT